MILSLYGCVLTFCDFGLFSDIIDPLKNQSDDCEKISIKTPKFNLCFKCTTRIAMEYFKEHINKKMRFTLGTIEEQMIVGNVPRLIKTCTSFIESYGLRLSGIYRISGAKSRITQLESLFQEDPLNFEIDTAIYKVHDVAVLLKQFFRQLKIPLMVPDARWMTVDQLLTEERFVQATLLATKIISSYSPITQATIKHLISHLYLISLLEKDNQE